MGYKGNMQSNFAGSFFAEIDADVDADTDATVDSENIYGLPNLDPSLPNIDQLLPLAQKFIPIMQHMSDDQIIHGLGRMGHMSDDNVVATAQNYFGINRQQLVSNCRAMANMYTTSLL